MLARRFTIVCLMVTIFGMCFAILVAEHSRPKRSDFGKVVSCVFETSQTCARQTGQ